MARLDDVVYDGAHGYVEFQSTVVSDRGPHSAESTWGADFAITADLRQDNTRAAKAVLGQAKLSGILDKETRRNQYFYGQCEKMCEATDQIVALETPMAVGKTPAIRIVRPFTLQNEKPNNIKSKKYQQKKYGIDFDKPITVGQYLVDFISCFHGDPRGEFVQATRNSRLTKLHILGRAH